MNKLFDATKPYSDLVGRVLIAAIFILSGWSKVAGYAGTQAYMQSAGVPGGLLPLVILVELGGGLAIVLGLYTRAVALSWPASASSPACCSTTAPTRSRRSCS
jgi:putative oxidoreductase